MIPAALRPFLAPNPASVFFVTQPKCGSQWVRDVLTNPALSRRAGIQHCVDSDAVRKQGFAQLERRTFYGPVYTVAYETWAAMSSEEDRVVCVTRDPRDMMVSWLYSTVYSHVDDPEARAGRNRILAASPRERLRLGTEWVAPIAARFLPYVESGDPRVFVTSYERLVADSLSGFRNILEFFGWRYRESVLREIVEQHAFARRSGRSRGSEDVFSHLRKGMPGDWKNLLDLEAAKGFEQTCSCLLTRLGYEQDNLWWKQTPDHLDAPLFELEEVDVCKYYDLTAENRRLKEVLLKRRRDREQKSRKIGPCTQAAAAGCLAGILLGAAAINLISFTAHGGTSRRSREGQ